MSVFFWTTVVLLFSCLTIFTIQKFFRKMSPTAHMLTLCLYSLAESTTVYTFSDRFCLLKRFLGDFAQTYRRVFGFHVANMSVFLRNPQSFGHFILTVLTIQKLLGLFSPLTKPSTVCFNSTLYVNFNGFFYHYSKTVLTLSTYFTVFRYQFWL